MNRIRMMRNRCGLTLQQLAARIEPPASYQQIARLERDERRLTWDWLMKIARALECVRLTPTEQRLLPAFREWPEAKRSVLLEEVAQPHVPTPVDLVAGA